VFYGAAGRLNPAWRPCNIGKLGQDNEDDYYYYYYYYYYYSYYSTARISSWVDCARV
jgi:hypothetical protein